LIRIVLLACTFGLAVIIVGFTTFWPVTVGGQQELEAVRLGLPVAYLEQNQALPPAPLLTGPRVTRFWSPWSNPATILWGYWLFDVAVVFLALICVPRGAQYARSVMSKS
jgi:hypothetical protein